MPPFFASSFFCCIDTFQDKSHEVRRVLSETNALSSRMEAVDRRVAVGDTRTVVFKSSLKKLPDSSGGGAAGEIIHASATAKDPDVGSKRFGGLSDGPSGSNHPRAGSTVAVISKSSTTATTDDSIGRGSGVVINRTVGEAMPAGQTVTVAPPLTTADSKLRDGRSENSAVSMIENGSMKDSGKLVHLDNLKREAESFVAEWTTEDESPKLPVLLPSQSSTASPEVPPGNNNVAGTPVTICNNQWFYKDPQGEIQGTSSVNIK